MILLFSNGRSIKHSCKVVWSKDTKWSIRNVQSDEQQTSTVSCTIYRGHVLKIMTEWRTRAEVVTMLHVSSSCCAHAFFIDILHETRCGCWEHTHASAARRAKRYYVLFHFSNNKTASAAVVLVDICLQKQEHLPLLQSMKFLLFTKQSEKSEVFSSYVSHCKCQVE